MADYATLKAAIQAVIYENGNQEITGSVMQATLLAMVNSLGANYQYAGIATPSTNPGTPDQNVFYLASTAGTYVNFGNIVLAENEVAILKYNGSWIKEASGFASAEVVDEILILLNGETPVAINLSQGTVAGSSIPATPAKDLPVILKSGKRYHITWTGLTTLVKKLTFYTRDANDVSIPSYWANGQTAQGSYSAQAAAFDVVPTADVYKMRLYSSGSDVVGTGTIAITIQSVDQEGGLIQAFEDLTDRVETLEDAQDQLPTEFAKKVNISVGKNLFNPAIVTNGKYFSNANGALSNNASFGYTDLIPIEGGKVYAATASENGVIKSFTNSNSAYYIFYDSNKTRISGIQSYAKTFTTPANAAYVALSLRLTYTDYQLEQAEGRTEYEPYSPIGGYPVHIEDGGISGSKLSDAVKSSIYGIRGNYLYGYAATLNDGSEILLGANRVKSYKRMAFSARVSSFSSLILGHGRTGTYLGSWVVIDGTNIVVHNYTAQDYTQTQAHGLTIGTTIQVVLEQNSDGNLKIRLTSNGETFEHTFNLWFGSAGDIYALSSGSSFTQAYFAWTTSMLDADIWVFGDSYISLTDQTRWSYYLITDGHSHFLINAQSGGKSAWAFTDLQALLLLGMPKKLIWAMGMNDPDSSTAVNSAWQSAYNSVAALCSDLNVELILTTIPTVSGGTVEDSDLPAALRVQKYKNAIIRNSGLRYIDFDMAVNANESTGQWYAGMLSNDGVHPTIAGALTLYHAAVASVPELLTT